ncbi:LysR family transcriptional regulator [Flaviflexus equikiangi]|uniref:LysR family transcriptional regulator n=1 Tax=Flaviflexus equikiangi TaxID=2758573 RepID=A0ABS2TG80_9ACTO|nr:LysR family transcriptional regulator [Flaviflexus equikiangi]MBM9433651.1 LysR family transcriptional regulator [Flaviflexus equikiangi]
MARIDRVDWLETFISVADLQSFSRASAALRCSQSRVSVHIAELEKSLGHRLIDRSRYPVVLTEAGVTFLEHARQIVKSLAWAMTELDQLDGTSRGHLTVGTVPSISAMFLPHVLRDLKDLHPGVRVDITERTTQELLGNLLDGTVDIAIRCDSMISANESSSVEPMWGEPIVAVFPASHPLAAARGSISPEELNHFELGTTGAPNVGIDPDMRARFDRWGITAAQARYFTEQPQTLLNLAKVGVLVPVINILAYDSCDHSGLAYRVVNDELAARRVFLQWNPARPFTPAINAFLDVMRSVPHPRGTVPITQEDL